MKACEDCGGHILQRRKCSVCKAYLCPVCHGEHRNGNIEIPGGCTVRMDEIKAKGNGTVEQSIAYKRMSDRSGALTEQMLEAITSVQRIECNPALDFNDRHAAHGLLHDMAVRYRGHIDMMAELFKF